MVVEGFPRNWPAVLRGVRLKRWAPVSWAMAFRRRVLPVPVGLVGVVSEDVRRRGCGEEMVLPFGPNRSMEVTTGTPASGGKLAGRMPYSVTTYIVDVQSSIHRSASAFVRVRDKTHSLHFRQRRHDDRFLRRRVCQ